MVREKGDSIMLKCIVPACLFALFMLSFAVRAGAADHRAFRFGGMEVIALSDVGGARNTQNRPELLIGLDEENAKKYLLPGAMANSINCFLVKKDGKIILFDTGLGAGGNGLMLDSLAAAGVKPGDVDAVVITHFHGDHIGGLAKDGAAVFPKARLFVPRLEVEQNGKGSERFMPLYSADTVIFESGQEVLPGITSVDARGHTPGHTAFILESAGERLFIIGDLIHFANIQLPLPDVAVTYDSDPEQAIVSRKTLFDRSITENMPIASMHMPFPGVGKFAKQGVGYTFQSAE